MTVTAMYQLPSKWLQVGLVARISFTQISSHGWSQWVSKKYVFKQSIIDTCTQIKNYVQETKCYLRSSVSIQGLPTCWFFKGREGARRFVWLFSVYAFITWLSTKWGIIDPSRLMLPTIWPTGRPDSMSHWKWRESNQQLTWWPDLALLGRCLVSLYFLCDTLSGPSPWLIPRIVSTHLVPTQKCHTER